MEATDLEASKTSDTTKIDSTLSTKCHSNKKNALSVEEKWRFERYFWYLGSTAWVVLVIDKYV